MAHKTWQISKVRYCDRVHEQIRLETEVVYPADHLPDQPPRLRARRCSHAGVCNQFDKPACVWAGTQPAHDPQ